MKYFSFLKDSLYLVLDDTGLLSNSNIIYKFNYVHSFNNSKISISSILFNYIGMGSVLCNLSIKVRKIQSNGSVCHMITEEGALYSWGEDLEQIGTLGMGHNFTVKEPLLNSNLSNKIITDIAVSEKHCCCLSSKFLFIQLLARYLFGEDLTPMPRIITQSLL